MQRQKSGDNHYLRRIVSRVTSMGRTARLRRQFSDIEQRSLELPRSYREQLAELIQRECTHVEQSDNPGLYGSRTEGETTTSGLDVGFDRARSDNVQVRMRGIALWLALVYQQTRGSSAPEGEELHRLLLRLMRELNVFGPAEKPADDES